MIRNAPRSDWSVPFPDVVICQTNESLVRKHSHYAPAKAGDAKAAEILVREFVTEDFYSRVRAVYESDCFPILLAVHAEEETGRNQIAIALSAFLIEKLDLTDEGRTIRNRIVQENIVNHTLADGFSRLSRQALFVGEVEASRPYFLVDDFIGQGGTLANLRGHVIEGGGKVVGAAVLTGKPYSAKISLDALRLQELRIKYGRDLEQWWQKRFGFGFECLTESEARYLIKTSDADKIRNSITSAG